MTERDSQKIEVAEVNKGVQSNATDAICIQQPTNSRCRLESCTHVSHCPHSCFTMYEMYCLRRRISPLADVVDCAYPCRA